VASHRIGLADLVLFFLSVTVSQQSIGNASAFLSA
jgi:hypothetical protein